jgi:TetR/AcrR family transcriptional repressor of nem operon
MRYKPEHKEETHRRIVETASQEFRAQGFEGVGIAKLMSVLNLTHGGFYAHFADKEALVAEASVLALDQSLDYMRAAFEQGGFPAVFSYYLSEGHRDHPTLGCPLPTLSAEVARHSLPMREEFTKKLMEVFETLAAQMPGQTLAEKRASVYAMFSTMVGAILLARAVSDNQLSKAILTSTHHQLLSLINEKVD